MELDKELQNAIVKMTLANLGRDEVVETPGASKPMFLALSGKKQVGKDTSAEILVRMLEESGKKVVVTAFAEPLKSLCIDLLGLDRDLVYGTNEDKETMTDIMWDNMSTEIRMKYSTEYDGDHPSLRHGNMTVREVLQVMGTDIFRVMFKYNVWAEAPFRKDYGDADVVILTDCRFPNEKSCTEGNLGVTIRLERDTGFQDDHPSEIALDGYDFQFRYENNRSLSELELFLQETLQTLGLINE